MRIKFIKTLLLHVGWVKKFEFVTEGINVVAFHLFDEIEALHLDKGCLCIGPHIVKLRLQE